jgi:hypothetical protein
MSEKRLCKADKWMITMSELTRNFGIALVEYYDGARLKDSKNGKTLGTNLVYLCCLYTAHRPHSLKRKVTEPSRAVRDIQGFLTALTHLSCVFGVRLEVRSAPMVLVDIETMEPLVRLVNTDGGYAVEELQTV